MPNKYSIWETQLTASRATAEKLAQAVVAERPHNK